MIDFKTFDIGDIVHIVQAEPCKENVEAMGLEFCEWPPGYEEYAGREGKIVSVCGEEFDVNGSGYNVLFSDGVANTFCWFGPDFEEFYGPIIDREKFIALCLPG